MSGNDPLTFVIQRNGVIVTKRLLDYETKPEYILIESRIIKSKSPLEDDISNLKLWVAVYKNDRFSFYNPFFGRDMETGFQNSKSHSPSFQRWLVCRRNKQLPLSDIQKELLITH